MKSLKLGMIAIFLTIAIVSAANAGPTQDKQVHKTIHITLAQASSNPGLIAAIYQQVPAEEFLNNPSKILTAKVEYQGFIFEITGTHDQWVLFFKMKNKELNNTVNKSFPIK